MRSDTFFILLSASLSLATQAERIDPLCETYQLWEDQYSCGAKGYFIDLAKKNCYLLTEPDLLATFTPVGVETVNCIKSCLVDLTRDYLHDKTAPFGQADCEELTRLEMDQLHPQCYDKCGFCEMDPKEVGADLYARLSSLFCKKY
uniref:ShKT domain-containing protein n=1 Tax=Steinernema glaseri TaxID=37863 RepID=A0A1I7Y529_9BILA